MNDANNHLRTPKLLPRSPRLRAEDEIFFGPHLEAGRFVNPWPTKPIAAIRDVMRWQLSANPYRKAKRRPPTLPVTENALEVFAQVDAPLKVLWVGHASFLLEIDGVRVLIDPIFGHMMRVVRRKTPAAFTPDALDRLDAVLVSHGHYDHFDRRSLKALGQRFPDALFCVPRGLARVLPRPCAHRVAFDWWEALPVLGIEAIFVPAQHWHRRGVADLNRALWGGWVVRGSRTFYHSGDTGYFSGFGAIGRAVGPIHAAALPLGAWAPRWFMGPQHMAPDESVQAFIDLEARHFIGMHWGTFDLSDEPIDEGVRELSRVVADRGLSMERFHVVPHGATFSLNAEDAASVRP